MIRRAPALQEKIYFTVQKLRKEPVKEAWELVKSIDYTDKKALKLRILQRGKEHLSYIIQHVPFYKRLKNRNKIENLIKKVHTIHEFHELLQEFPVTEKKDLIQIPHHFFSDEFEKIPTYITTSSGTTGQSIAYPKDMRDWAMSHANMFYVLTLYNIHPHAPYIYYWAGDWGLKSRLINYSKDFLLNRIRFTGYNLNTAKLLRQVKLVLKFKPFYILGIPSGIYSLSTFIINEGFDMNIHTLKRIFTTGELLTPYQRRAIEKAFKVKTVDIYGSSEFGNIYFECPEGHKHIFMDTNYVEVDSRGNILITNFFQKAFAFIRYKIGDIAYSNVIWDHDYRLAFPIIKGISGRSSDMIKLPDGKMLPPMAPTYIFDKVSPTRSVIKFRYVLVSDDRLLLYLVVNNRYNKNVENLIVKETLKLFNMRPEIHLVQEIKPLNNGKERYFLDLRDTALKRTKK